MASSSPEVVLVSWKGYAADLKKLDSTTYFLNRQEVGIGDYGFQAIIRNLEKMPENSIVIIDYIPTYSLAGGPIAHDFPFGNYETTRNLLINTARDKNITIYSIDTRDLKLQLGEQ